MIQRYCVMVAALLVLSACAHTRSGPEFIEDTMAIPVEEEPVVVEAPGSLWTPSAKFVNMYGDLKASRVGDIVVVQVVESSSANKEAKTESERSSSVDNSIDNVLGLPLDASSVFGYKLSPTLAASSSSDFETDGKTSRKGSISAVVSARVVRVLPSGNMMINGKKQIRVNNEHQYIILSGIVRPEDISPSNSIQSTYIADLHLDYYGSGIIGDQQNKGILGRAFDKIWPF
ncbi:MAG: flagellar basal body L-ring protein FlgH [Desulfomonilia bacterium]|nr:flagellar basal body L-ring protein FlgH [Desulfomonilia bacterium]